MIDIEGRYLAPGDGVNYLSFMERILNLMQSLNTGSDILNKISDQQLPKSKWSRTIIVQTSQVKFSI